MFKQMSTGMQLATIIILIIFLYLFCVVFTLPSEYGYEASKSITPYLLAIVTTLVGFYFGKKHENQTAAYLSDLEVKAKVEAAKLEEERVTAARIEAEQVEKIRLEAAKIEADNLIDKAKTT
jgi:hypothetical protein